MAEVHVEGLKQFASALHAVSEKYPKKAAKAGFKVAKSLATYAKANGAAVGGKGYYGASAETIKAFSRGLTSSISGGGSGTPYFWAAEFGGLRKSGWYSKRHFINSKSSQWLPWRGNQWGGWAGGPGYMIHPAIRDHADEELESYAKELDQLYRIAFPS